MKRYRLGVIYLTVFTCALATIMYVRTRQGHEKLPTKESSVSFMEGDLYRDKEQILLRFVQTNLTDPSGGIVTNTCTKNGDSSILSESIGLILYYSLIKDDKNLFESGYQYLKSRLLTEDSYIKWKTGGDITCNASIDDLRIISALFRAHERWGDDKYLQTALISQQRIYEHQVLDGKLHQLYDWKYDKTNAATPLCYLNLGALRELGVYNKDWVKVYNESLDIVEGGRIGDTPFFYKHYNFETEEYFFDEEYVKGDKENVCVNLLYTLCTAINVKRSNVFYGKPAKQSTFPIYAFNDQDGVFAARANYFGQLKGGESEYRSTACADALLPWLKGEMDSKNRLYAWYEPYSQRVASPMESTAIYALAAIYANLCDEKQLEKRLLDRMLEFMVSDEELHCYGGFGDLETEEFYSFDNLTALLALALTK